jgi:uncharacterized Fe-S radical SAM superfamily protein PflX
VGSILAEPAGHRGLTLPIVYNTSAYDSVESIELMDGIVDIYLRARGLANTWV